MTIGEASRGRDSVVAQVLRAMIGLTIATAFVQAALVPSNGLAAEGPWIATDAAAGGGFYLLLRAARAGRERLAARVFVAVLGADTALLLVTGGSDHPLWAVTGAFTVAMATLLLDARGALVTLAIGTAVVLPVVVLEDAGTFEPLQARQADRLSDAPIAVEMLLLLLFLAWTYRLVTRDLVVAEASVAPVRARTLVLTPREVEVVRLIADGQSNDAIAARLVVSPRTVHSHVTNAMRKCGCANRTELGVLAVREGLVPLTPRPREPATARTP